MFDRRLGVGTRITVFAKRGIWQDLEVTVDQFINPGPDPRQLEGARPGHWVFEGTLTMRSPGGWEKSVALTCVETLPPLHTQLWLYGNGSCGEHRIDLRKHFGPLAPGRYQLRWRVPGGGYRIDREPGIDLETSWVDVEILPLGDEVWRAARAMPTGPTVRIRPSATLKKASDTEDEVRVECVLENGLGKRVELPHWQGQAYITGYETLDADLQWVNTDALVVCSAYEFSSPDLSLEPGARMTQRLRLGHQRGIYRVTIRGRIGAGSEFEELPVACDPVQVEPADDP